MNELRLELKQEEQVIYDKVRSEKEESCKNKSNPKRTPLYRHRVSVSDIHNTDDYDEHNSDVMLNSRKLDRDI